jgi:predicted nucleic acid-binding protein
MILEAAVNGGADAIVTFNTRHYVDVAERFGIEVLKPGELLRRLQP